MADQHRLVTFDGLGSLHKETQPAQHTGPHRRWQPFVAAGSRHGAYAQCSCMSCCLRPRLLHDACCCFGSTSILAQSFEPAQLKTWRSRPAAWCRDCLTPPAACWLAYLSKGNVLASPRVSKSQIPTYPLSVPAATRRQTTYCERASDAAVGGSRFAGRRTWPNGRTHLLGECRRG